MMASSVWHTVCFARRHWSQISVTCQSYWFRGLVAPSYCAGARCLGPQKWLQTYEMVAANLVTQIWVWLLRNAGFKSFCCEIELVCVLPLPWPRWPDFLLFTNINGYHADWGCPCLFPVCGWFEGIQAPASTVFYAILRFFYTSYT